MRKDLAYLQDLVKSSLSIAMDCPLCTTGDFATAVFVLIQFQWPHYKTISVSIPKIYILTPY